MDMQSIKNDTDIIEKTTESIENDTPSIPEAATTTVKLSKSNAAKLKKLGGTYNNGVSKLFELMAKRNGSKQPETATTSHVGLQEEEVKQIVNKAILAATFRIKEDMVEDMNKALETLYLRIKTGK